MSEQCRDTLRCNPQDLQQAMSIHTRKITDSCRDKDCIEDLRVYLTTGSQQLLDTCANAKVRSAELLYTYIDVEPVAFDGRHYCIDVTFYYKVLADAVIGAARPATLYGVAAFSKRAVLCGEDSCAHIFRSDTRLGEADGASTIHTNLQIPGGIRGCFDEDLVLSGDKKRLYVTLGQFSIIRLERDAQLIVPVLDYAIPTKDCCDAIGCAEDPCEMFSRIPFPAQQFAPQGCDSEGDCGYQTTCRK